MMLPLDVTIVILHVVRRVDYSTYESIAPLLSMIFRLLILTCHGMYS